MLRQCLSLCGLLLLLSACSKPVSEKSEPENLQPGMDSRGLVSHFSLLAYQSLAKTTAELETLESSLAQLMQLPNPGNLEQTQHAWLAAHNAWLKARLLTHLNLADSHTLEDPELLRRIDSWPVMGGYIDYLPGYPFSGIVNDLTLPMKAEVIQQQQGFGVSQGFHALEFMLWGENGERSARDFIPQENTRPLALDNQLTEDTSPTESLEESLATVPVMPSTTPDISTPPTEEAGKDVDTQQELATISKPQNHMRRRQYVRLISHMLSEDMQKLQKHWEPAQGYYTELLASQPADNSLRHILQAMQKVLLEDMSEQLVAKHEDQHSAFNLQQHRSYQQVLMGLDNFYQNAQATNTLASALNQLQPEFATAYGKQLELTLNLGQKIAQQKQMSAKNKQSLLEAVNQLQRLHSEIPTALKLSAL